MFCFFSFDGKVFPNSVLVWRAGNKIIGTELNRKHRCYTLLINAADAGKWRPYVIYFEYKNMRVKYGLPAQRYEDRYSDDMDRGRSIFAGDFSYMSRDPNSKQRWQAYEEGVTRPDWKRVQHILEAANAERWLK